MIIIPAMLLSDLGFPAVAWVLMVATIIYASVVMRQGLSHRPLIIALSAFALIPLIGLHGIVAHQMQDVRRDIWLMSKPIVELLFGYLATRILGKKSAVGGLFLAAIIAIVAFLFTAVSDPAGFAAQRTSDAESYAVYRSLGIIIPLIILSNTSMREELCGTSRAGLIALVMASTVGVAEIAMGPSRTLIALLVILVAMTFFFKAIRVLFSRKMATSIAVILAGLAALVLQVSFAGSFRSNDVVRALEEISVAEYDSPEDIAEHWRGYETFLALRQFGESSWRYKIFGGGVGQAVALDFPVELAGGEYTEIPVFHNGFAYIITKSGLSGLIAFFLALGLAWRAIRGSGAVTARGGGLWPSWWFMSIVATTTVIGGPFNPGALIWLTVTAGIAIALATSPDNSRDATDVHMTRATH